jgi:hypothetical protein
MKLTLDWNCVIEVEEVRPQSGDVLELVRFHRLGVVEVALLAASASENTKSKVFPGNAKLFKSRVRWSSFFDQFAALLRWIRVSCQAANLIGSVLFA